MIVDRLGIHFLKWGVAAGLLLYGACVSPVVRTDGMTAFEQKQYHRAIPLLSASLESATTRKEKGQLAFLVAECYRLNGRDDLSADWYRKAVGYNHGIAALSGLAYALKRNNRYAEARALFKDLGVEIGSPYAYRKEITACTLAEDWLKQVGESGIKLENLAINSAQNDFAPVVMPDQTVVFTSDRIQSKGHAAYGWTGNKFMDLYRYNPAGGSLFSLPPPINTTGNEGTACPGKSQLFFVRAVASSRGQTAWNKIFVAGTTPDGGFGEPLPLPFQQEGFNYLHPALAPDNRTLVFAANLPGGWGQYDLYAVSRDPQSETGWGTPIMLPRNINTPGNELFPSFYGDTLFFSSDELPGMGGLDIFKTFQTEPNTWAPPINLKPPVNSSADDMSYRPISDPAGWAYSARTDPAAGEETTSTGLKKHPFPNGLRQTPPPRPPNPGPER
jgi:tetratricopeptide (TPR) repeat protein